MSRRLTRTEILAAIRGVYTKCEDDVAFGRTSVHGVPLPAEICDAGIALRALCDAKVVDAARYAHVLSALRNHHSNAARVGLDGQRPVMGARRLDVRAVRNAAHSVRRAIASELAGRDEAHNLDSTPSDRVRWHRELPRLERHTRAARADLLMVLSHAFVRH